MKKMRIGIAVVVVLMVAQFQVMNSNFKLFSNFGFDKKLGEEFHSMDTSAILFCNYETSPQSIFYAERNVRFAKDEKEAQIFLKHRNFKNGYFVTFINDWGLPKVSGYSILNTDSVLPN